jgi:hypothetical protein
MIILKNLTEIVLAKRQQITEAEEAETALRKELDGLGTEPTVSFKGPQAATDLLDWLDATG